MKSISIQKEPIDTGMHLAECGTDEDGSIVSFTGRPRKNSNNRTVTYLEYESYDGMARKELEKISDEAALNWKISSCTVAHRTGRIEIGEASIFICVASPHRAESFQACMYIIDQIKKRVPIWKKEFYTDGSSWVHDRT
ncbi:MAG: molybdenum cofactor biosynthesis protein MoaE [Spirochaetes bacterium]|jgi:molybdopterin synthase catalytic subunit|nr:molybdenum cofactor biosynthesis protein MoaE [Spirochaetota bacterium]